ncbi:MAG: hypothetical protein KME55_27690 [Nostoc indistinguendum CM1-VF10]|nr:hypothetical protein [Nostoc indistinguendum CM1-VF10]
MNFYASSLVLTTQVLQQSGWTPAVIEQQQEDSLQSLRKIWRLYRGSQRLYNITSQGVNTARQCRALTGIPHEKALTLQKPIF